MPYEYIYNDTRAELPETYEWLNKVEQTLGIKITRLGKDLETIIREQEILPTPSTRFCTKYAKIYPMHDHLGKDPAIIYIGIRADEAAERGIAGTATLTPVYPLRELGVTLPMVYEVVDRYGLRPPDFFWERLYGAVRQRLGEAATVIDTLPRWAFERAFAWRSRPNCYFCFYQRRYEWVGLLEHHPELFARAEAIEAEVGMRTSGVNSGEVFYWLGEGFPLSRLRNEAERIFNKRVKALSDMFFARTKMRLWTNNLTDELDMVLTSCGAFCGK